MPAADRTDRRPDFPSTRWSRILTPGGQRDLEALAQSYWRPMRAYLATRLCCSDDRADDLAQEAFAWMLTSGLFDKADPARGSFRGYLKRALGNFAIEQFRRANAHKRGGDAEHHSIDDEAVAEPVDAQARTPEQALDDCWRRDLLQRAQSQLQAELESGPRATYYRLFADFFLADSEAPAYAVLAQRYAISKTDVSNWLDYAKRRYRAILHELVRDTVSNEDELREELRWLFGADAGSPG